MTSLLVHGIYDEETVKTLNGLGAASSFDLRVRSRNLVPIHKLKELLKKVPQDDVFLQFANDSETTVLSVLDLLRSHQKNFKLLFRDQQDPLFYAKLRRDFYWMFDLQADFRSMLELNHLRGVFLPLKWAKQYETIPKIWEMIENRRLDVFLHADHISELTTLEIGEGLSLSLDLSQEMEKSYRSVDQDRLKGLKSLRGQNAVTSF